MRARSILAPMPWSRRSVAHERSELVRAGCVMESLWRQGGAKIKYICRTKLPSKVKGNFVRRTASPHPRRFEKLAGAEPRPQTTAYGARRLRSRGQRRGKEHRPQISPVNRAVTGRRARRRQKAGRNLNAAGAGGPAALGLLPRPRHRHEPRDQAGQHHESQMARKTGDGFSGFGREAGNLAKQLARF